MELAGLLLTLSSLTVSPDRSQFFKYESLSLSCESSAWRVKARTVRGVSECGHDWGRLQESTCIISGAYTWNSGEYWCQSTSGETSPAANITVTDSSVILESPVFPVTEGQPVTLRCTTQSNSSNLQASIFLKDRSAVGAAVTGQMTIPAMSKADEGLYMCVVTGVGASSESWLTVRGQNGKYGEATERKDAGRGSDGFTGNVTEAGPGSHFLSASRLTCRLLVGAPYLLSTILLGLVHRDRARGRSEGAQRAEPVQGLDKEFVDVTTEHHF